MRPLPRFCLLLLLPTILWGQSAFELFEKSRKLAAQNKLGEALKLARQAEAKDITNGLYSYHVGVLLRKQGRPAKALKALQKSTQKKYLQPWVLLEQAMAHRDLKQFRISLGILERGPKKFSQYKYFKSNLPYTYYLAVEHAIKKKQRKKVSSYARRLLKRFDYGQPYEAAYNRLLGETLKQAITYLKSKRLYRKFKRLIKGRFAKSHLAYEHLGLSWFAINNGYNKSAKYQKRLWQEVMRLRRKSMKLYEAKQPGRKRLRGVAFPLRGLVQVGNNFNANVWSHTGLYGKYCYDLGHIDKKGNYLKPGTKGKNNDDYLTFGQPLYAVKAGTVLLANDQVADQKPGVSREQGNSLIIEHPDGTMAIYVHLKQGSLKVQQGQQVTPGQPVAAIGNTGPSAAPHLHFCMADKKYYTLYFTFKKTRVWLDGIKHEPVKSAEVYEPGQIFEAVE